MVQTRNTQRGACALGLTLGLGLASLLSVVSPGTARAGDDDPVRYQRPSGKVTPKTTLRTKVEKARAAEEKKRAKVSGRSSIDFAKQRSAIEQAVASVQIKKLRQLLELTDPGDAEYPDLLFRLADLHLSVKAFHELQAGTLEELIYADEEAGEKQKAAAKRAKQQRHRKDAKTAGTHAVRVYSVLAGKRFVKFKRLDEALYFYAFELGQLGKDADMQAVYTRLIRDFPVSRYTPNAFIAFADHRFVAGDIENAIKLYKHVVDGYDDSPMFGYALYKLGWCYLNPGPSSKPRYEQSLQMFVSAVKATMDGKAGSEENARLLRRDARRDMVRAYVHAGRPSAASSFFKKVGTGPKKETMARTMTELLAGAYFGEGMYVESSAIYRDLQTDYPSDPETCEWQYRVVINALATDDGGIQWTETERLADAWKAAADAGWSKKDTRRCRNHASDTLRQMATVWHDEADKTGRMETYARSEDAYERYLEHFAADKGAYDVSYYYAELLWQRATKLSAGAESSAKADGRAKFGEARTAFVAVLESKPEGKWAKEAVYAQMLAMKNHVGYDETATKAFACVMGSDGVCAAPTGRAGRRGSVKRSYDPIPLAEQETSMLDAYDLYAKFVKKKEDPELPKILYHRARILVEHNMFDEALPVLQTLVVDFDGSRYSAWGAGMLLDALTVAWTEADGEPDVKAVAGKRLARWAERVSKLDTFKHTEAARVRAQVPKLLAAVGWIDADYLRQKGVDTGDEDAFVACGRKYLDLFNDFPEHDRGDALLFNAARCLEAGHLVGGAIKARTRLLEDYPNSSYAKQSLKEVGQNYQRIAYYDSAAQRYEEYATRYAKDEFAAEALQNAFLFRLGLGDDERASENLVRYEQLYRRKDPNRAAGIYWARQDLLSEPRAKIEHAEGYISKYGKKGGLDRLVVAHATAGQVLWRKSCSKALVAESCVTITRRQAQAGDGPRDKAAILRRRGVPKRCGSEKQAIVKVHARDPKMAEKARKHFRTAASLAPKVGELDDTRRQAFEDAWGMSLVYAADTTYEEYLEVQMPEDLDFGYDHDWKHGSGVPRLERQYEAAMKRRKASNERLAVFFSKKDELGSELLEAYSAVPKTKSKFWTLASAARAAVLNQNFADQLYRAPVPKNIKTEAMYEAYCDEIALLADKPQKRAEQAFTYCLERSTEFQYFNEFSRMCEDEMQQRDADTYPATNELFGASVYTQSTLDVVPVQTELTGTLGKGPANHARSGAPPAR